MKTFDIKQALMVGTPDCPRCGCRMIALKNENAKCQISQAATVIKEDGVLKLICFQCRRIESKRKELQMLPPFIRWRIKIDKVTGIFTTFKRWKKRTNDFIYFKIKGGTKRPKNNT